MNELASPALLCVFAFVIGGGLLYFGGRIIADWWFGRVPGGRGK